MPYLTGAFTLPLLFPPWVCPLFQTLYVYRSLSTLPTLLSECFLFAQSVLFQGILRVYDLTFFGLYSRSPSQWAPCSNLFSMAAPLYSPPCLIFLHNALHQLSCHGSISIYICMNSMSLFFFWHIASMMELILYILSSAISPETRTEPGT